MVRTKDKKPKGDEAFKTQKQKIGKKKLAPVTATRAEVHARTLRIVKPRDEVITPETINRKRDANDFLTSKADASQRVTAQAGGAGWEKHRPDRSLQENLMGAAHYREATRASSFTALNTTVDHFASAISPSQFMQLLNVTLGAVTDTGADVREKALALFMKLLKLFPPPMTSDGVRHIMTYIRISLTHAQPGVRRSGIKMLGAFAKQWPGAIRKAYADTSATSAAGNPAANAGASGAGSSTSAASAAASGTFSASAAVSESALSKALSSHPFVAIGCDGGAFAASSTSAFLRTSDSLAHQGGVLNGTIGSANAGGAATFVADSNNPKATSGVEVSSIYDTTTRAKTFDIEQIIDWATEVAANAPISQQHRMMPVIATLLEEVLPFRAHAAADQSAELISPEELSTGGSSASSSTGGASSAAVAAAASVTLPLAFVERYFKKFASRWAMQWKELMELGYKMFRDAIIVERITAIGRCFAACTIYLHRHGRLFTPTNVPYGKHGAAAAAAAAASSGRFGATPVPFDARWMLRELFLHKVPFTMKELTSGSTSSSSTSSLTSSSIDHAASAKMTVQDQLLRGPLMTPKAAAAANAVMPSRSRAAQKLAEKGHQHLTIVPTAKTPQAGGKITDATQLTVFDALAAVANVSVSRLRIAEVIAWCLLPIASDKQEQQKCNSIISSTSSSSTGASSDQKVGSKRGRDKKADPVVKRKQTRAEEGTDAKKSEKEEEDDAAVDEHALGKPDMEADEKDSDGERDLDEEEEEQEDGAKDKSATMTTTSKNNNNSNGNNKKGNDNVAQAKRLVKTFIESPNCPMTSAVQMLRAFLYMYPHLYPTLGMPLLATLLKRAQTTIATVTPITIAAPTKPVFAGQTAATTASTTKKEATSDKKKTEKKRGASKKNDNDEEEDDYSSSSSSDDSESDDDHVAENENSKAYKERNASAAFGSQCGRDLRDLVTLVSSAMANKYVLMWPSNGNKNVNNNNNNNNKVPVDILGELLRDQIPKTLFSMRQFASHPSSLPPAHSPAYNNAARRQIAMAHDRVGTLAGIMRTAVQTYHDAVTMRHPALYSAAVSSSNNNNNYTGKNVDALLKRSLTALFEVRMKRGEGQEDVVIDGPLKALEDSVLVNMAKGTLSYLE